MLSVLVVALVAGACTVPPSELPAPSPSPVRPSAGPSAGTPSTTAGTFPGTPTAPSTVEVRYRIERRTDDRATDGFAGFVRATLGDDRGWARAGFELVHDPEAPYAVVLAEGPEVDELCAPYDTYGRYSCQLGPVVALNADRWRTATPEWTGDLETYRRYLVNHEVGHLLGLHHPTPQCPAEGLPAAVMSQQSTELDGCLPNGWPLDWEVELAGRHELPLAPGYEPDPSPRPNDPRSTVGPP